MTVADGHRFNYSHSGSLCECVRSVVMNLPKPVASPVTESYFSSSRLPSNHCLSGGGAPETERENQTCCERRRGRGIDGHSVRKGGRVKYVHLVRGGGGRERDAL